MSKMSPFIPSLSKLFGGSDCASDSSRFKVLVACHPRSFDSHWQKNLIKTEVKTVLKSSCVDYETVDINAGGTHRRDVLDWSFFHETHNETYDMIWLPDCGGMWYEMFVLLLDAKDKKGEEKCIFEEEGILRLERILNSQMRLLKPGGYLYMSKIMMELEHFQALVLSILDPGWVDAANPDSLQTKTLCWDALCPRADYLVLRKKQTV